MYLNHFFYRISQISQDFANKFQYSWHYSRDYVSDSLLVFCCYGDVELYSIIQETVLSLYNSSEPVHVIRLCVSIVTTHFSLYLASPAENSQLSHYVNKVKFTGVIAQISGDRILCKNC